MSRFRWGRVVIVAVALGALGGCDIDVGELILKGPSMKESTDPEVLKANAARQKAEDIKEAEIGRDAFLKSGDDEALDEAVRRNGDDPELRAYDKVRADLARLSRGREAAGSMEGFRQGVELLNAVAKARKARNAPTDLLSVRKDASMEIIKAMANMLRHGGSGALKTPAVGTPDRPLFDSYCEAIRKHDTAFRTDNNLFLHRTAFGEVC